MTGTVLYETGSIEDLTLYVDEEIQFLTITAVFKKGIFKTPFFFLTHSRGC